jgi:hypothetical protein
MFSHLFLYLNTEIGSLITTFSALQIYEAAQKSVKFSIPTLLPEHLQALPNPSLSNALAQSLIVEAAALSASSDATQAAENPVIRKHLVSAQIGVVAGCTGQVRAVRSQLRKAHVAITDRNGIHTDTDLNDRINDPAHTLSDVEVKTIHGFQGREKEVIVLSCTRSNAGGDIGFLQDVRRLNVAVTRARRGLIVVGNAQCLARGSQRWGSFLRLLHEHHAIVPAAAFAPYLATCTALPNAIPSDFTSDYDFLKSI